MTNNYLKARLETSSKNLYASKIPHTLANIKIKISIINQKFEQSFQSICKAREVLMVVNLDVAGEL